MIKIFKDYEIGYEEVIGDRQDPINRMRELALSKYGESLLGDDAVIVLSGKFFYVIFSQGKVFSYSGIFLSETFLNTLDDLTS